MPNKRESLDRALMTITTIWVQFSSAYWDFLGQNYFLFILLQLFSNNFFSADTNHELGLVFQLKNLERFVITFFFNQFLPTFSLTT